MSESEDEIQRIEQILNRTPLEHADRARAFGASDEMVQRIGDHFTDNQAALEVANRAIYFDVLKEVVGVDPVVASAEDRANELPSSGWLVRGGIVPGFGGVVTIYRYPNDQLTVSSVDDQRPDYGYIQTHFNLTDGGIHTTGYENPAYPNKDVEPYERMGFSNIRDTSFARSDIIALGNGGRIIDQVEHISESGSGSVLFNFTRYDIDRLATRASVVGVDVIRITDNPEELGAILVGMAAGMGLEPVDIRTFVSTVSAKVADS